MAELREELKTIGLDEVETYINSGNIFFTTGLSRTQLVECLSTFFEKAYPFIQRFSLLSREDYEVECANLPQWWTDEMARKDVLFYTVGLDRQSLEEKLLALKLGDEVLHLGKTAVFWGKYSEESYAKTAYHKQLMKMPFYRQITIRNANTFDKIGRLLKK